MTAYEIIRQVQEDASEYLEMADNPFEMVSLILANKLLRLDEYITYLEKRLEHDSSTRIN